MFAIVLQFYVEKHRLSLLLQTNDSSPCVFLFVLFCFFLLSLNVLLRGHALAKFRVHLNILGEQVQKQTREFAVNVVDLLERSGYVSPAT